MVRFLSSALGQMQMLDSLSMFSLVISPVKAEHFHILVIQAKKPSWRNG